MEMTREEAIYELEDAKDGYAEYLSIDAINIAIEALKQPEIIRCGECEHFREENNGEMWCGVSNGHSIDKNFFCRDAERRTDEQHG